MKDTDYQNMYIYKDAPEVLINKLQIKDPCILYSIELLFTETKFARPKYYPSGEFDLIHYQKIHKYLFKDIYSWAGELRKAPNTKNDYIFCEPKLIASAYNNIFKEFIKTNFLKNVRKADLYKYLARYHSMISRVNPCVDGNGRTTNALLSLMVNKSHKFFLNFNSIYKDRFIQATKDSRNFDNKKLENLYRYIVNHSKVRK